MPGILLLPGGREGRGKRRRKSVARGRDVSHTQTEEGNMLVGSARSVDHFEKLEQIGEGTYGQVREQRKTSRGVTSVNVVPLNACAKKKTL